MRVLRKLLAAGVVFCMGCQKTEPPARDDSSARPSDVEPTADEQRGEPSESSAEGDRSTHIVVTEAAYYKSGPQQARPADGTFPAKTKVTLIEEAGSYCLVRSDDGIEAYVAANVLQAAGDEPNVDLDELAKDNNQFALDLYGELRAEPGNLFFSPNGISTALAMTYAGADGETAAQMARVMHFDLPSARLHPAFSALVRQLTTNKAGTDVRVANRLWGQSGYQFLPEYLQVTRQHYGAELGQVDFIRQTEAAREAINSWVEEQTSKKIKNLIPEGVLDDRTRLVLTNAFYFKGDWVAPFDQNDTKVAPFRISADESVDVPLMFQSERFRYAAVEGVQMLELPYAGDDLSMWVVLPAEADGLAQLEETLTADILEQWSAAFRKLKVGVYLPKFKLDSDFSLGGVLQDMGMTAAFDAGQADFSGMIGRKELSIAAVVHKSYVEVNEEGTEAAAATGVVAGALSVQASPEFRADHPFVFLIRDNRTGSILFMGRVANPLG